MNPDLVRIAMWSGPRNISTAMMRSFGNRSDCFVTDEPFYAYYLRTTQLPHPGAAETLAAHESNWQKVVAWLTGPVPNGKRIWYQKHMTHHLLPEVDFSFTDHLVNCFLIRDPAEMITSLLEFIPRPRMEDTGVPQQLALFHRVRERTGRIPPVIEGRDVLEDPKGMLRRLCDAIGIEFTVSMLHWPPGLRETDGVWAPFWYEKVAKTTGFGRYSPKDEPVPDHLRDMVEQCRHMIAELREYKL